MQFKVLNTIKSLFFFVLTIGVLQTSVASAKINQHGPKDPAHLGPIGLQLKLNLNQDSNFSTEPLGLTEQKLKELTDTGSKAIAWLNLVNEDRALANKLVLADRNTKNPVPPNLPKVNSVKLMLEKFGERINALPPEIKDIVLSQKPVTKIPPISDELFITHIRELNSSYQNALRWIQQQPWLSYYAENARYDIRGIYFSRLDPNFNTDLANFTGLEKARKKTISEWLISICTNARDVLATCKGELNSLKTNAQVKAYYESYLPASATTYREFFQVKPMREELKWNQSRTVITQDFILPSITAIADWLKSNVEEEWKALNFQLLVNYKATDATTPFIDFQKGVTPNVSGSTWNKITMDPDYSLDDFSTQWTIRHEFGHVLGFPDCYLEFYEPATEEMIYYTIEPDNLMCAWGGKLQPSHVSELQRVY